MGLFNKKSKGSVEIEGGLKEKIEDQKDKINTSMNLFGGGEDDSDDEDDDEADIERYERVDDNGDDLEKAKEKEIRKIENLTSKLSPEEMFTKFDTDGSGFISVEEFTAMLPELGINVSHAKAAKIFKSCDKDGGGEIDLEEFKMAMFAVDTSSGNTLGFTPNNLLTPKDAFELFDEDGTGQIDELEFADILEYLGMDISDEKQESMFLKYDKDKSGYIDYSEFRAMWVRLSDVKGELTARGIEIPKYVPNFKLHQLLEKVLDEEEELERQAMEEANRFHNWQLERERRGKMGHKALLRAQDELAGALDAAGQVYVLGRGSHGQFDSNPAVRDSTLYTGYDYVSEIWESRVNNTYIRPEDRRMKKNLTLNSVFGEDDGKSFRGSTADSSLSSNSRLNTASSTHSRKSTPTSPNSGRDKSTPRKAKEEYGNFVKRRPGNARPTGRSPQKLNKHTAKLQKKKNLDPLSLPPSRQSIRSEKSDILITSPDDEVGVLFFEDREYVRSLRFKETQPMKNTGWLWGRRVAEGAISENVAYAVTDVGDVYCWGGRSSWWKEMPIDDEEFRDVYQVPPKSEKLTPRSEFQKMCTPEQRKHHKDLEEDLRQERLMELKKTEEEEEKEYERLKILVCYFDLWEPPTSNSTKMLFMKQILLPKVPFQSLHDSIKYRGHVEEKVNKDTLIDVLSHMFVLEIEILGSETHQEFKQLEKHITEATKKKKKKTAMAAMDEILEKWRPLLTIRDERQALKQIEINKRELTRLKDIVSYTEEAYCMYAIKIRVQREDIFPEYTKKNSLKISLQGITSRGPPLSSPRGGAATWKISAGGFHAALITHNSTLYTWGIGINGRLAHGKDDFGKMGLDISSPTSVTALQSTKIKQISCAFSHNGAIDYEGNVFCWGSATTGKLGVGQIDTSKYENFSHFPILLKFPQTKRMRQISCGNAHTACITTSGEVYVWGCANGGRLGLGSQVLDTVLAPTLVKSLLHVRAWQVSCGNCHSALCTEVFSDSTGLVEEVKGGEVYVCGSALPLGTSFTEWTLVSNFSNVPVKQVSCGYSHTALISTRGELYTWGRNRNGCTGHIKSRTFIPSPELVRAFHVASYNLAIGKPARQSSVYNLQDAGLAVNGSRNGKLELCAHTQLDDYAYWEVNLGQPTVIEKIRVWNRTDVPKDPSRDRDEFISRLFPFVIMVSEEPFTEAPGKSGFRSAKMQACCYGQFSKIQRLTEWLLPSSEMVAQYVRIQLNGTNFLHVAEVEVFGVYSAFKYVGEVSSIECGNESTLVIMRPISLQSAFADHYIKAIQADPDNAVILRQYETYFKYYQKYGRGDSLKNENCRLCRHFRKCEICEFFENTPSAELPEHRLGGRLGLKAVIDIVKNREPPRSEFKSSVNSLVLDIEEGGVSSGNVVNKMKSISPFKKIKKFNFFQKQGSKVHEEGVADSEETRNER